MVRYALEQVTDEMILGQSIFNPTGELLLAAGYHVTERYRKRLKELGYTTVLVEEEGTEGVIPETVISEHVQREMTVTMNKSMSELNNVFSYRKMTAKTLHENITKNKGYLERYINHSGIARALEKLIDEIMNQSAVVLNLSAMDKTNHAIFTHVLNVTVTAVCLGRKYRLSYDELKQLGMGALNYDLGLVAVPKEIVDKKEPLTDDEKAILQQHTVFGHLMLSQNPTFPSTSSAVALQHHEFQDGSGYPRGIKGDNRPPIKDFSRANMIHRFAEIVAVADCYDMLANGRPLYCESMGVQGAIRTLIEMSGTKLNSHVVKTLLSIVPVYPVGARVRITNAPITQLIGYTGVIAKDNLENLEQPQVILYETRRHQKVKPILIDLAKHKGFTLELSG